MGELLTPTQAALDRGLNLGLSARAIRAMCARGEFQRVYDYPGGYKLDRDDLIEWKNARLREVKPEEKRK